MDIWGWIRSIFIQETEPPLGALPDPRPAEVRAQEDISIEETVASASLLTAEWREIPRENIRTFPVQNQRGKSSCVAETRRKIKRVMMKVNRGLDIDFSSIAFYRKRSNYPTGGMIADNAIKMDAEYGMTLDAIYPSDACTTEAEANKLIVEPFNDDIARAFRTADGEVHFNNGDLDTMGGTIQKTRKATMLWFYFTKEEWSREVPIIITKNLQLNWPSTLRHSVTGIEPAIYKGKQGIWIEDSAHFGGVSRRFITREFYEARNWHASYPIAFRFEAPTGKKPTYDGTTKSLQICLKHEGVFPSNVDATGYYGALTTQAVKDFQARYHIEQTGTVGPKTTAKLKELYP